MFRFTKDRKTNTAVPGVAVKTLREISASHFGVPKFKPQHSFQFHLPERQQLMVQVLRSLTSTCRPALSSRLCFQPSPVWLLQEFGSILVNGRVFSLTLSVPSFSL